VTADLLPECVVREDGCGSSVALEAACGKRLLLTMGITRTVEHESLDVSIWGSADERTWRMLAAFTRKHYCGNYSLELDLSDHPDVRYVRVQWKTDRWARGEDPSPLFGFYLLAEQGGLKRAGAGRA
jgi:hypothetical protein